jgi:glycosyltransferase involved in cell wall biosynthesis
VTSFSVVIPTLRRPETLPGAIESLLACVPLPDEIIVVDGDPEGSARDIVETLAPASSTSRLLYLASETGSTTQRNRGIDASTGDVIVFFDDDVIVDADIFAHFASAYRDAELVGVTGNERGVERRRLGGLNSSLRRWLTRRSKQGRFTRFGYPRYVIDLDREHDVERQGGSFMSARREAAAVIRFDELLTGYALAEDEDFSYRLSRLGRVRYVPSISIWHEQYGVRDRRAVDKKLVLNRTYLFKKNFPQTALARTQFGLLLATLLVHRLVNREWDAAHGLLDGYRELWRRRRLLDDPRSFILGTRVETKPPSDSKTRASKTAGEE